MKKFILLLILLCTGGLISAQSVVQIFFNDSVEIKTYKYVDKKRSLQTHLKLSKASFDTLNNGVQTAIDATEGRFISTFMALAVENHNKDNGFGTGVFKSKFEWMKPSMSEMQIYINFHSYGQHLFIKKNSLTATESVIDLVGKEKMHKLKDLFDGKMENNEWVISQPTEEFDLGKFLDGYKKEE